MLYDVSCMLSTKKHALCIFPVRFGATSALFGWDCGFVDPAKPKAEKKGGTRTREYRAEFLRLWSQVREHYSQAKMARLLHINPSNISKYLSPASDVGPSKQTLMQMGRILNLPVRLADEATTTTLRDREFYTEEDEVQLVMALRRAERDPVRRKKLIRILAVLLDEMARPISYRGSGGNPEREREQTPTEADQIWREALARERAADSGQTPQSEP